MGFTYIDEQEEPEKVTSTPDVYSPAPELPEPKQSFTFVEDDKPVDGERKFDKQDLAKNIGVIRDTMTYMKGDQVKDWSDDEAIDNYLEYMRYFTIGNSLTTLRTVKNMFDLDDKQLARVGEGLTLYEEMPSAIFDGGTWKDKRQALGDFTGGVLLDPVNVLSLGLGKLVTGAGAKVTATAARRIALKKTAEYMVEKGVSKEVAMKKVGEVVLRETIENVGKETAANIAKRTALTQAEKGIAKFGSKTVLAETFTTISADAAVAAGTEYFYQDVMTKTGAWEEYKPSHIALAALGTMILGGAAYSLSGSGRGLSGYKPKATLPNQNAKIGNVLADLTDIFKTGERSTDWKTKVAKGKSLKKQDDDFWYGLLDNMLPALEREGYVWVRKNKDDKVSNWIADLIKTAEPEDARKFMKEFGDATGIKFASYDKKGLDAFANDFAKKMNKTGKLMGKAGEIARKRGLNFEDVSINDLIEDTIDPDLAKQNWKFMQTLTTWGGRLPDDVRATQNNLIRLIVSNLSTTRLNLVGYGMATTYNSFSDVAMGALYGAKGVGLHLIGKQPQADYAIRTSKNLFGMQLQKARNMMDPNTSLDQFISLTLMRPQQMRELTAVLQGGIEDIGAVTRKFGLQPNDTVMGANADRVVDLIQKVNFVQAQDMYTKSQEFLYQMDKNIRHATGKTLPEVLADPDLRKVMATKEWAEAEAKAVWETQRAIFSASYRRAPGELGKMAAFIEDFRNIPFIGITIPFGRFYNNVLATTMDASGLSLMAKLAPGSKFQAHRSVGDLATRAAVAWTAVSYAAMKEEEYIDRGLGVFEWENDQGDVVDMKYTFPGSLIKGVARLLAYKRRGEEPPATVAAELEQIFNVYGTIKDTIAGSGEVPPNVSTQIGEFAVGQLTRDLTDATDNILEIGLAMFRNEGLGNNQTRADVLDLISAPVSAAVSAGTRFLEPLNVVAHLIKDSNLGMMDVKDGSKLFNESFRYIDGFPRGTTSKIEKVDAAGGKRSVQADKFFGDRAQKLTATERVMNMVGIDTWKINQFTDSAAANNLFNQYFHSALDEKSEILLRSEKFRNGDLEMKKHLWDKVRDESRKMTVNIMSLKGGEAAEYEKIIKLNSAHSSATLSKALDKVAGGKRLHELGIAELTILEDYLSTRDLQLDLK